MTSPESYLLPPDCAMRQDFPGGEVHIQLVGVESAEGPAHIDLYAEPFEAVSRTPRLHLRVAGSSSVSFAVEAALREAHEHDACLSDGDYGCIALDSLGAVIRRHQKVNV